MACFACDKAGLFGSFSPAGFAASEVEQVAYTLASGEKVSLTAGSELAGDGDEADSASYETVWRFAGDADTDLDQDKVQSMLSALSSNNCRGLFSKCILVWPNDLPELCLKSFEPALLLSFCILTHNSLPFDNNYFVSLCSCV